MAFIQINEPEQKQVAQQIKRELAVGIDLGTTYCSVAQVNQTGGVDFFTSNNQTIIPSLALYTEKESYFGYEALEQAAKNDMPLIHSVKRLMGIGLAQVTDPDYFPYQLSHNNQNNLINIHTAQGIKNPIEVSADLLANLKQLVFEKNNQTDGEELLNAVITVPAYFDDSQRQATKDAGKIAGINVLRIINEPTAAALAYGLDQDSKGVYAVYDIGGGTFDFSILKMQKEIFQVLACSGDSALGGNDFDQILIRELLNELKLKVSEVSHADLFNLWQRSKEIKHCLTHKQEVETHISLAGVEIDFHITQSKFEKLIEPLIEKTIRICQKTIVDSKQAVDQIKGIVLVGGSSRIPLIHKRLREAFGCELFSNLDPDTVVAKGAAIQADNLVGNANNNALLLDVTPLSLGIEIMGGLVEKIIHRNTPIPIKKSQFFTTFKDNQTAIAIHVLQGEREKVEDCRSLAKFSVKDITPMKASNAKLEVTFQLDADGILVVSAYEHKSKKQAEIMVKPSYGLEEGQIEQMIQSSYKNAQSDANFRKQKNTLIKAKRLAEEVASALKEDGSLLSDAEQKQIHEQINRIGRLSKERDLTENKRLELITLIEDLTKNANQFANKRLQMSLRQIKG